MTRKIILGLWLAGLAAFSAGAGAQKLAPETLQAAHEQGRVRVMVTLHSAPQAPSRATASPQERTEANATTDAVLRALPPRGHVLRHRYAQVPAIALDADPATLRRLRDHPSVRSIDIDAGGSGGAVEPDEATRLNKVSDLKDLGLDGAGLKVAVIDTGVDTDHADLQARLIGEQCFCSGGGGCCPNGSAVKSGAGAAQDDNGHGTNVAGIIVGEGSVVPRGGVPAARLVAIKVLDRNNRFCCTSDVVAALDWLATAHPDVDVVNLSLGTDALFGGDCDGVAAYTQALSAAVNALVERGAVVTVSSGNAGGLTGMAAPACVRNALSVGATWDFAGGRSVSWAAATSPQRPDRSPASATAARPPTCLRRELS